MAICPHCKTPAEAPLQPCPRGDGFFCVDEADLAANKGDDLLGRAIGGRFVVAATLGSGSMAQVYRAYQLEVERTVALKIFRVGMMDGPSSNPRDSIAEARGRFAQEARVLGKLAHPNCVTLYDYGADEPLGVLYIAMEHVAGVSLRSAINRGLSMHAILSITRQVLLALQEAHALEIVHRDLKPENVIITFRGDEPRVKVVDFGIAKLLGHDRIADMTRVGALFGTPAYMSPEQCRGEADAVGPHSDVYALGCLLFEMVSGQLPFDADHPARMIQLHTDAPIPPLEPRAGLDVPLGLPELVYRCLAKRPEDRFADAPALLAAFRRVTGSDAVPDHSPGTATLPKRVTVPRNQISGTDIEPPPSLRADTPMSGSHVAPPKVETRPQQPEGSADPTGGISQSRISAATTKNSASNMLVFLAFGLLLMACVVLFWFLWQMTR